MLGLFYRGKNIQIVSNLLALCVFFNEIKMKKKTKKKNFFSKKTGTKKKIKKWTER